MATDKVYMYHTHSVSTMLAQFSKINFDDHCLVIVVLL